MDNFMDKLVQKLGAQESIRANSAADAAQMEKLQAQAEEYDKCMKEMRRLILKNTENQEKLQVLMDQSGIQLQDILGNSGTQIQALIDQGSVQLRESIEKNSLDMQKLVEVCMAKIAEIQKPEDAADSVNDMQELLMQIQKTQEDNLATVKELFIQADDFVHKENVKVYRNVQAVVVAEFEKQTLALVEGEKLGEHRVSRKPVLGTATLIIVLVNLALVIVHLMGIV